MSAEKKYSFQKEWHKSARVRVLLVTAVLLIANDMFGLGLTENAADWIAGLAAAFISGKSLQDALAAKAEVEKAPPS